MLTRDGATIYNGDKRVNREVRQTALSGVPFELYRRGGGVCSPCGRISGW